MSIFEFLFGKPKKKDFKYQRLSLSSADTRRIAEDWKRIDELIKLGGPSQLRQAVIRADVILDSALMRICAGETMGERLKNARSYFNDPTVYQGLWEAHKVRNALAHDVTYEPTHYILKISLNQVKSGLKSLGVK